jgi:D-serine deaminase-like pyridoxal phosphate-dependent protein
MGDAVTEIGQRKDDLDTPFLWVDLAKLERNVAAIADELRAAGVAWRPHTKGIKTPAIAHMLVRAGAVGVTCAKLGEAEVMAATGIRDILVANQVVGPHKVARLAALQRHADVKVAVDSVENVEEIAAAATAKGVVVGVLVELDTGMHRTGLAPGSAAVDLAQQIVRMPGVALRGLMTWEGHNLEYEDPDEKRRGIEVSIGQVRDTVELFRAHGLPVEVISGGGSGTYKVTANLGTMTEIQAGGAIFCDQTYQSWGVDLEAALFIRTRTTSRPTPSRVICDAGFKCATRGFAPPRPVDFPVEAVRLSAEHGIITLAEPRELPRVGETFDMVVGYGDATVFLHDVMYGVRDGVVETIWEIEGRGKLR